MLHYVLLAGFLLFSIAFLVKSVGVYGDYRESRNSNDLYSVIGLVFGLILSVLAFAAKLLYGV